VSGEPRRTPASGRLAGYEGPGPAACGRRPLHRREIRLCGYERDDGRFEVEGWLVDTKAYAFENRHRGRIEPGEPLHAMGLRLVVDEDLVIHDAEAVMEAAPFSVCPAITPAFKRLVGLRIGPGFRREVRNRLGGVQGCTHLVELLPALATTAIQTIMPIRARRRRARGEGEERPPALDGCHALRRDGPVVREYFPEWFTGEADPSGRAPLPSPREPKGAG